MNNISFEGSDGRLQVIWREAGLLFVSNILSRPGLTIPLHAHAYDHVAMCTEGRFAVTEVDPDGAVKNYTVAAKGDGEASAGYKVNIPAGHQHTFRLLSDRGEILCIARDDA